MNRVDLIGRVTKAPEIRKAGATSVLDSSIAINRRFKSGDEIKEETTFVDLTFWGRTAEIFNEYVEKGELIAVEGRLTQDSWEAEDGSKRSKLKVTVDHLELLATKGGGSDGNSKSPAKKPAKKVADEDEDIPF